MMYLAYLYSGGGNITQAYVSEQGWVRTNSISCHTHIDRHIVRHLPVVILEAYVAVHTSSLTCDMLLLFLLPSDNVQHDLQLGITHTFPERKKKTSRNKRKPMHHAPSLPPSRANFRLVYSFLFAVCLLLCPTFLAGATSQTHVGANAVSLLLTNRERLRHWKGPIVCVCLTNHALDQFLCNLLDADVTGIVRQERQREREGEGEREGTIPR